MNISRRLVLKRAENSEKIKHCLDILAAQMFAVPQVDGILTFEKDTDEVLSVRHISSGFDAFHDAASFLESLNRLLQRPESQKKIKNSLSIYHVSADEGMAHPLTPEALGRQCLEVIGCQDQPWVIFWHNLSHSCHIHILVYRLRDGNVLYPRAWPLNDLKAKFGSSDISMTHERFKEKVIRIIPKIQACDRSRLNWELFNDLLAGEGLVFHPDPSANGGARLSYWSASVPGLELTASLSMNGAQEFLGPYPKVEPRKPLLGNEGTQPDENQLLDPTENSIQEQQEQVS